MTFLEATAKYERWLGRQIPLIRADLLLKHKNMREASFPFFRATFYRWAELFPEICPEEFDSPSVLGVGDLHVENFGTWRDAEGRLVWGVNDFDEATYLPYLLDIVRLITSVSLGVEEDHLKLPVTEALDSFLSGYREYLESGGLPIVLAEQHPPLRTMARARLKEPEKFWNNLTRLATIRGSVPKDVRKCIQSMLPGSAIDSLRYVHRIAGLGSLGRRRFVALGMWNGALVAREAKEIATTACCFAGWSKDSKVYYQDILDESVRSTDPFVKLSNRWLVRRLAPDCSRIELASLGDERDELRLLHNMGRETANIHLTKGRRKRILKDLDKRKPSSLLEAVKKMAEQTREDWKEWKRAKS